MHNQSLVGVSQSKVSQPVHGGSQSISSRVVCNANQEMHPSQEMHNQSLVGVSQSKVSQPVHGGSHPRTPLSDVTNVPVNMLAKVKQINAIPNDMQTASNRSVNSTQLKKPTVENENQLRSANTQNLHFDDELAIMNNFFENCTIETRQFMHLQLNAARTKDSRGHRWNSQFSALCLR